MNRRFKTVGIALATVFAIGALFVSGAQAGQFTSLNTANGLHEGGTFTGDQITETQITAGSGAGALMCAQVHYSGTSASGTETEPILIPAYKLCTVTILGSSFNTDVSTNGCTLKFHFTEKISENIEYRGTADIVCPAEQFIHINIRNSSETTKCTIKVGPQTGLNNIVYRTNTFVSPTDIEVEMNTNNLTSTTSVGGLFGCGIGNGVHVNGTYVGTTTLKGFNGEGPQVDLTAMG